MPFATAPDGIQLYYETLGTGDPLLLVSGRNNDHHLWDIVRGDFAAHYQVIVYDHRGTGRSDKPELPPYATEMFAQDAVAILDHLGIRQAHAYGASMGGLVCQWIAINYPDRVGALILGCTTAGRSHRIVRSPQVAKIMADGVHGPRSMYRVLTLLYSPLWLIFHFPELRSMSEESPQPVYAAQYHAQASEGHDAWDLLPTIKAPTLVIHGSADKVAPIGNAPILAERIPGAELYIVKGGRHLFFVEFREEAGRVVNEFIAHHPLPKEQS